MIENPRIEEENKIKEIKNLLDYVIKDIRNLFRQEKGTKAIKERTLRNIKNFFEHEEEKNYKPVKVVPFGVKIMLNMKVAAIEINHSWFKNILIKLDST